MVSLGELPTSNGHSILKTSQQKGPYVSQKTAFLFPGQGSQFVGMAQDLYDAFPAVTSLIDRADEILGYSLSSIMFGNPENPDQSLADLTSTDNTQPALYLHSMAAFEVMKSKGLLPDVTAGHSLGEYSALAAAGYLSFEDGLRLVRLRGQAMADAGQERGGTMAAILGLENSVVDEICMAVSEPDDVVCPANYNSPGQIVVSGDIDAVARCMNVASENGARKVIQLNVSGAFHSPLMKPARARLNEALQDVEISDVEVPVYLNVTGRAETDTEAIRTALSEQMVSPVKWAQSLEAMKEDGVEQYYEVGAGRILAGLLKRTLGREITCISAGTTEQIQGIE